MHRDLPDFDTLVTLHKEQPEELERIRSELTNAILENTTGESRRRLQGLQFRINMELRKARTPEARFIKMSSMMHEAFAELNQVLHNPEESRLVTDRHSSREATILPFSSQRDRTQDH
ncbi:MAG: DUF3135 domain-containing protein [Pseudomonadota bacterium]